ncbi:MAG: ribosome small subunit-dependent GTPase A [Clostridia bacterium]|nr:ribosome small subunit-dependent GTPase A [Clostridia bacterium]
MMAVAQQSGLILQSIGGFYYVETADAVYECKARGAFRKEGVTPLSGDRVTITAQADGTGILQEILPRRNALVRPPVANLDCLAIVASVTEPKPNLQLLDKLIAIAEDAAIEPIVVITKSDLDETEALETVYRTAGFPVFVVTNTDAASAAALTAFLQGKITAFTGNSGVGKSSLLNLIDPALCRETGEISKKLGRGRHTTRSVVLLPLSGGGYLADTPGFSALDIERTQPIDKDALFNCFREFEPYFGKCRFTGCSHVHEPDCAIQKAVEAGEIALSRYESYVALYSEAKERKPWENT